MSWVITPSNLLVDDQDALTYLAAVESADGQALESATRLAVNAFVKGCKADGIWPAIKASCILAGARTLTGALVPLVGAAPTNVGGLFVSGDYNRKTGLVGNGSTKYLNSNRNNNADPQNSKHLSSYLSTTASLATYAGALPLTGSGRSDLETTAGTLSVFANSVNTALASGPTTAGLCGVSRSGALTIVGRNGGTNYSGTVSSTTAFNGNIFVFCRNLDGSPGRYTNSRLAFYSIGESLNLALLDDRVTDLINAFAAAIP